MTDPSPQPVPPRWLHALAVSTALLTLPLLFFGAGVTSHGVGMVDPRGFRPPWEILQGLIENSDLARRLEYGHRTLGFLVGLGGIFLAIGCWFFHPRGRWLGLVALALICVQGSLGIFRVDFHARFGATFAMVHGLFAQVVFATLVCIAVVLSRRWTVEPVEPTSPALQHWSIATAMLVGIQLILGGLVRHTESPLGPRGHLLGAFVVVGAVVWLLKLMRESQGRFRVERILLMGLLALQLLLGVESWLARFFDPRLNFPQLEPIPMHGEWIRTAHYLVGTLIFSTSVVTALIVNRKPAVETAVEHAHRLEAAL